MERAPEGYQERRLRDEVADLRAEVRTARARLVRDALGPGAAVALVYAVLAVAVTLVPRGTGGTGGTFWIVGLATVFAGLCTAAGLLSTELSDAAAELRGRLSAARRRHRDLLLDSLPASGPPVERALLDDLDDARDVRGRVRRQVVGHAAVLLGAATTLAVGLVRAGPAWSWTRTEVWVLVAAFGTTAFGAASMLTLALAGRQGPARDGVRRAERRFREFTMYGVGPDDLPDPARRPVPPVVPRPGAFWVVPIWAVLAALVVHAPPDGDPATAAAAAAAAGVEPPPPPTVLAARRLSPPLNAPGGIVVGPEGHLAYVANHGSSDRPDDTVSQVDLRTDRVVGTVDVAPGPLHLALSPDGRRLYVTARGPDASAGVVSVVDTAALSVVATVAVAGPPTDVVVGPDGRWIWVTTRARDLAGPDAVSVIDTGTAAVVATTTVGHGAVAAAVAPDGARVYVANSADGTVSVLDAADRRVVATVPVGVGPRSVAVEPDGRTLWVADEDEPDPRRALVAVDTATLAVTPVDLGPPADGVGGPQTLALTADGRRLLVAHDVAGPGERASVRVVDTATRTGVGTLTMPSPYRMAPAPDGHHAYATAGSLWSIDIP